MDFDSFPQSQSGGGRVGGIGVSGMARNGALDKQDVNQISTSSAIFISVGVISCILIVLGVAIVCTLRDRPRKGRATKERKEEGLSGAGQFMLTHSAHDS